MLGDETVKFGGPVDAFSRENPTSGRSVKEPHTPKWSCDSPFFGIPTFLHGF
jgi:hypothetical protein